MAGSIFGQSQAQKAQEKYNNFLEGRRTDLKAQFDTDYNTPYLNSQEAQGTIKMLNDQLGEAAAKFKNNAVSTQATPEAQIAGAGELQKRYGQAVTQLASMGTQYKNQVKDRYDRLSMNLDNQKAGVLAADVQKWGNFGQNVSDAGAGLMNAWAFGAFDKVGSGLPATPTAPVVPYDDRQN